MNRDNTFANDAEANRSFWRQTVLPLVGRTAQALARWLAPDEPGLRLAPDLDRIDALADEREALWRRVGAASFLTDDEKRAAVGYGAAGAGKGWRTGPMRGLAGGTGGGQAERRGEPPPSKGNWAGPDPVPGDVVASDGGFATPGTFDGGAGDDHWANQPRVPAGNPDGGQWTSEGGVLAGGGRTDSLAGGKESSTVPDDAEVLRDSSGNVIKNSTTNNPIVYPKAFPPEFFIRKGEDARRIVESAGPNSVFAPAIQVGLDLWKFRHGGEWDAQRLGGKFNSAYVDFATVAIGLYGASVGMSENQSLAIQNAYAKLFSKFSQGTKLDSNYDSLPTRNVENTAIGYQLYREWRKH